jgi:hypothetical protein
MSYKNQHARSPLVLKVIEDALLAKNILIAHL